MSKTHHSYQKCMIAKKRGNKKRLFAFFFDCCGNRLTDVLFHNCVADWAQYPLLSKISAGKKERWREKKDLLNEDNLFGTEESVILLSMPIVHLHYICFLIAENNPTGCFGFFYQRKLEFLLILHLWCVFFCAPSQMALACYLTTKKQYLTQEWSGGRAGNWHFQSLIMKPHLELGDVYSKSHLLILHMKYNSTNDHMEQIKASSLIY